MASLRRVDRLNGRGKRAWEVRYRDPEGRHRQRTFPTKPEAQRFARQVEVAKDERRFIDPRRGKVLFGEWADRWEKAHPKRKATTVDARTRLMALYITPSFGSKQLSHIRPIDVQEFVTSLEDRGLSPSRVRNAYFVLKPCIDAAVASDYISRSPCVGIKLPEPTHREMSFLSAEQVRSVADAVPEQYRALVYTLALGGLRWGEAVALRKECVDLEAGLVRVRESCSEVNSVLHYGTPKSGKSRSVVLPRFVIEMLAERVEEVEDEAFVFTSPEGAPLRSPNWRRRVWAPALKAAGLPPTIRIHDLRHTCASLLANQGAHPKAVMEHLGHASISTTIDRYSHLFPDEKDRIAKALDESFTTM